MRICNCNLLGSPQQAVFAVLVLLLGGCVVPDNAGRREISGSEARASGWKIPFWGTTSSPVLAGGLPYVGSGDGAIYALGPGSGGSFQTGFDLSSVPGTMPGEGRRGRRAVHATPVVENGTVFVGSRDFSFYAIDSATGRKKWSFKTEGEIYDSAAIHGGDVVFTSADGFLYAVDAGTGFKKWAFQTLTGVYKRKPSAILEHGVVYLTNWPIASAESYLYAIDAASGLAKWMLRTDGGFPSEPRNIDGLVYFSTRKMGPGLVTLHAADAASGKVIWTFDAEAKLPDSDPVIAVRDMVLVGTDRGLFALDRKTGALRWSRVVEGSEMFGPVHADDSLLYLTGQTLDGKVQALDPATGKAKWSSSPSGSSPFGKVDRVVRKIAAIRGDTIYAGGYGYLYALHRDTGRLIWSFSVLNAIHASPLIAGDMIFMPSTAKVLLGSVQLGYLYAIDATTGKL